MPPAILRPLAAYIPHGTALSDQEWAQRHRMVSWILAVHIPGLAVFALALGRGPLAALIAAAVPAVCLVPGVLLRTHRRAASGFVTLGLVACSATLVILTNGTIEAHFHFFIVVGIIALYQDWFPFLLNIAFTVLSHGLGSAWFGDIVFNHHAAQHNPWLWSGIHGVAVLCACAATAMFWRVAEEQQEQRHALTERLGAADIARRKLAADLLVNLARRNQGMVHRQAHIIDRLEQAERDPDTLSELFALDHLTTRIRRNAESLLVLSGEQAPRVWARPVSLHDVVRAAIAETEDLNRVRIHVDEQAAVLGHTATDLIHLLAELIENAVRSSPPGTEVVVRTRPDRSSPGGQVLTVEDCGVGMPAEDMASANELLAHPPDVDAAVSSRLGMHVIGRLAARHAIRVSLTDTPGSGVTAVVALPAGLFAHVAETAVPAQRIPSDGAALPVPSSGPLSGVPNGHVVPAPDGTRHGRHWTGWWAAGTTSDDGGFGPSPTPARAVNSHVAEQPAVRPSSGSAADAPDTSAEGTPGISDDGPAGGPGASGAPPPGTATPAPGAAAPRPRPAGADAGATAAAAAAGEPSTLGHRDTMSGPAGPRGGTRVPGPNGHVNAVATGPAGPPPREPDVPGQRPGGSHTLRRRVPQASLAPELREPDGAAPEPYAPPPERAAEAAHALSRFQARRDAARSETGDQR